jgi:hypothetical protein
MHSIIAVARSAVCPASIAATVACSPEGSGSRPRIPTYIWVASAVGVKASWMNSGLCTICVHRLRTALEEEFSAARELASSTRKNGSGERPSSPAYAYGGGGWSEGGGGGSDSMQACTHAGWKERHGKPFSLSGVPTARCSARSTHHHPTWLTPCSEVGVGSVGMSLPCQPAAPDRVSAVSPSRYIHLSGDMGSCGWLTPLF